MNSILFYTCSRCKVCLPEILKPLHKEKCKKKKNTIITNNYQKVYESDIEQEKLKIGKKLIIQKNWFNSKFSHHIIK